MTDSARILSPATLVAANPPPYSSGMLSLTSAAILALAMSFLIYGIATLWYVVPWMRTRSFEAAVTPLLWMHTFRYVALLLVSAQQFGLAASDTAIREIVFADLAGVVLAVVALMWARRQWRGTKFFVWLLVLATIVDLTNALRIGLAEDLFASAHDVSLTILTFLVPLLWISVGLMVWA